MTFSRRHALVLPLALPAFAVAATLEQPKGAVVLAVSGKAVSRPNRGPRAEFDMAMLERLPQRTIDTATPWYPSERKFTGPLGRDVLAAAGATGNRSATARCVALNDYKIDIPLDDFLRYDVVIARLLDGKPMSVREKGPLFVIYPFDTQPALRTTLYFSRCIWQLAAIELV